MSRSKNVAIRGPKQWPFEPCKSRTMIFGNKTEANSCMPFPFPKSKVRQSSNLSWWLNPRAFLLKHYWPLLLLRPRIGYLSWREAGTVPPPLLPEHFECLEHSHRLLPRYKQFRVSLVSSSSLKNLDDFFYLFLDNRLHSYLQTWVMSLEQKKLLPVADSLPIVLSLASIVWCLWLIRGNGLILRSRLISRRRRHCSLLFRRHHRRCRRRLRRCERRHNQNHFTSNGGIRRVVQSLVIPWLRVGICCDLGGGCYCWVLLSVENVIRWAPSPPSKELFNEFLLLYNHLQINGVNFLSQAG